jgi:hypothetical protein
MIWRKHTGRPLETIARTGFLVSLTSYTLFWLADAVRPGFVSRYFSVHMFLLATIVFGLWWANVLDTYQHRPRVHVVLAALVGVVLAVLTWGLAPDLGFSHVPVALIALITPTILYTLIRT